MTETETCVTCGSLLEPGEHVVCQWCLDQNDALRMRRMWADEVNRRREKEGK